MLHVLSFYTLPTLKFFFQIPVDFLISVIVYLINRSLNVKGSKRKRSNMMKPAVAEVCDIINTSPDEDILPSSNDLSAMKSRKENNKVTEKILPLLGSHDEKESRQCPQHRPQQVYNMETL